MCIIRGIKNIIYPKNEDGERKLSTPKLTLLALGILAIGYTFYPRQQVKLPEVKRISSPEEIQSKLGELKSLIPQHKKLTLFKTPVEISNIHFKNFDSNVILQTKRPKMVYKFHLEMDYRIPSDGRLEGHKLFTQYMGCGHDILLFDVLPYRNGSLPDIKMELPHQQCRPLYLLSDDSVYQPVQNKHFSSLKDAIKETTVAAIVVTK